MSPEEEARVVELDARWRASNENQVRVINRLLNGATYEEVLAGQTARIAELTAEVERLRS